MSSFAVFRVFDGSFDFVCVCFIRDFRFFFFSFFLQSLFLSHSIVSTMYKMTTSEAHTVSQKELSGDVVRVVAGSFSLVNGLRNFPVSVSDDSLRRPESNEGRDERLRVMRLPAAGPVSSNAALPSIRTDSRTHSDRRRIRCSESILC